MQRLLSLPSDRVFMFFVLCIYVHLFVIVASIKTKAHILLAIGRTTLTDINPADVEDLLLQRPALPPTPTTATSPQWKRQRRCMRKQKRGKRAGIRARLAASPHRPAIPTITLANVRSLENKLDYIRLLRSTSRTVSECCVFVFVETWLNNSIPDCAIQLARLTCYRADRELVEGGKTRGGGLCVYISDAWWSANTAHHWRSVW